MSTQESESALDAIVQQTWKRARTSQEIGAFLTRRFAALDMSNSEEFDDIEDLKQSDFELAA